MSKILVLRVSAGRFSSDKGDSVDMSDAVAVLGWEPFQIVQANGDGSRGVEAQAVYVPYDQARGLLVEAQSPPCLVEGRVVMVKATKGDNRALLQVHDFICRVSPAELGAVFEKLAARAAAQAKPVPMGDVK